MIILLIFAAVAVMALVGFVMATATDKTIAIFNQHGLLVGWTDSKIHGVGAAIMILGIILMCAVIATVIAARRKP